jgi:carbonic anhydrase
VEQLSEVPAGGDETTLNNLVSLQDLLPAQTTSFYRYSGSLTTPKCNQIVTWTVFDNPLVISEQQVSYVYLGIDEATVSNILFRCS